MNLEQFKYYLNFEVLTKLFFDLAEERYPSGEKARQAVLRIVAPIGESGEIQNLHLQIAVLNMMRDMVREVSPAQIYRSIQHRDDLFMAIIEALEDLEDELEDLEEGLEEDGEEGEDGMGDMEEIGDSEASKAGKEAEA